MSYWSAMHVARPGVVIRELTGPAICGEVDMLTLAGVELSPQVLQLQTALSRHAPPVQHL